MKKSTLLSVICVALLASVTAFVGAGEGHGHKKKHDFLKEIDTNGDGVISREEHAKHADARFTKMDKNGNGTLEKDELRAMHKERREKVKDFKEKHKEKHKDHQKDD